MTHSNFLNSSTVKIQTDRSEKVQTVPVAYTGAPNDLGARKALRLEDGKNVTLIHQPDFKDLGIDGARMCVSKDFSTVLSQSWGQGWRPVKIPAKTYEDRLDLVCDPKGNKSLGDWVLELETPLQGTKEPEEKKRK